MLQSIDSIAWWISRYSAEAVLFVTDLDSRAEMKSVAPSSSCRCGAVLDSGPDDDHCNCDYVLKFATKSKRWWMVHLGGAMMNIKQSGRRPALGEPFLGVCVTFIATPVDVEGFHCSCSSILLHRITMVRATRGALQFGVVHEVLVMLVG